MTDISNLPDLFHTNILIKEKQDVKKTSGGIFLPDSTNHKNVIFGTVVKVHESSELIVNDNVVIENTQHLIRTKIENEEYIIVKENEVLMVLED